MEREKLKINKANIQYNETLYLIRDVSKHELTPLVFNLIQIA